MKKVYNAPTIIIENFEVEEILLTSGGVSSDELHNFKEDWFWGE